MYVQKLQLPADLLIETMMPMYTVRARYSEGPPFRNSIVQIRTTVLTFGLGLGLGLGSALGLGLGLVGIVDFRNSGPLE